MTHDQVKNTLSHIQPRQWLTNAPEFAAMLNDAETNHIKRRRKAESLPLAEKIVALRESRKQLAADYDYIHSLIHNAL